MLEITHEIKIVIPHSVVGYMFIAKFSEYLWLHDANAQQTQGNNKSSHEISAFEIRTRVHVYTQIKEELLLFAFHPADIQWMWIIGFLNFLSYYVCFSSQYNAIIYPFRYFVFI
jgi:hypothetical protein